MKIRSSARILHGRMVQQKIIWLQAGAVGGLVLIYLLLEATLLEHAGVIITALSSLPVILVAWMYGRRAGVTASVIISLLSLAIIRIQRPLEDINHQLINAFIGLIVLLILCQLASGARRMRDQLRQELSERSEMEFRLRESEERYRTLFNHASDAIFLYDLEGNLLEVNDVACQRLGYSRNELLAMNVIELETLDNAARLPSRIKELRESGEALYESAHVRRDATVMPIELNTRLITYQGQTVIFCVGRDISQRKIIENAEREQHVLANALHDIAADLTSTLQLEEVLERILKNTQRVIHHDAATIMLLEGNSITVKKHSGYAERGLGERIAESTYQLEDLPLLIHMARTKRPMIISDVRTYDGWRSLPASYWVRSYAGAPIVFKGQVIGFLNIDSSYPGFFKEENAWRLQAFANYAAVAIQNARLYANLEQQALIDELTGLYNRRGLQQVAEREVARAIRFKRPLAAMLVDVDNFKVYNDLFSYSVGDEILASMAHRLRSNVRKGDLVCRYGGDEFVVILIESNRETALRAAEHARQAIHTRPFETCQGMLSVTVSVGVADLSPSHSDITSLIEAAGEQLHHAKQSGRNQVAGGERLEGEAFSSPPDNGSC